MLVELCLGDTIEERTRVQRRAEKTGAVYRLRKTATGNLYPCQLLSMTAGPASFR